MTYFCPKVGTSYKFLDQTLVTFRNFFSPSYSPGKSVSVAYLVSLLMNTEELDPVSEVTDCSPEWEEIPKE